MMSTHKRSFDSIAGGSEGSDMPPPMKIKLLNIITSRHCDSSISSGSYSPSLSMSVSPSLSKDVCTPSPSSTSTPKDDKASVTEMICFDLNKKEKPLDEVHKNMTRKLSFTSPTSTQYICNADSTYTSPKDPNSIKIIRKEMSKAVVFVSLPPSILDAMVQAMEKVNYCHVSLKSLYLCIYLSIYLYISIYIYISIYLSIYLYIYIMHIYWLLFKNIIYIILSFNGSFYIYIYIYKQPLEHGNCERRPEG